MKIAVPVLCLAALLTSDVTWAGQSEAPAAEAQPTAPQESPTATASSATSAPPAAQGPAEPAALRARRHSAFSAGEGGALFVFTEVISGLTSGALLGSVYGSDPKSSGYIGALMGAFALGSLASAYQYFVPVERVESLLIAGGAATGFLAGLGYTVFHGSTDEERALLTFFTTQIGILGTLLPLLAPGDVSDGDGALVGMTALYAFTLTGLIQATIHGRNTGTPDLTPTFAAPLFGMVLGGLLATYFDLPADRIFKLTVLPLGMGAALLFVGAVITAPNPGSEVPLGALAGIGATFIVTTLATSEPPGTPPRVKRATAPVRVVPVPMVMAAGRRNESLAGGLGLVAVF